MSAKRIYRMAYHTSLSKNSRFRIHQLRDGDAFAQLSPVLYSRGYEYGGLLLNLPSEKPPEPIPVDTSFLTSSDLVVLNTRPPIDDLNVGVRHRVSQSFTTFELDIFNALRPKYFELCARSQITLSKAVASKLRAGFKDRANMLFHTYTNGSYISYGEYETEPSQIPAAQRLTAAFLVQIPAIWEGGPGLVAAFGLAGIETLAWNYLLRTRFRDWLDSYQFVMAEVLPRRVPKKPTDLSFVEQWDVEPVLSIDLGDELTS